MDYPTLDYLPDLAPSRIAGALPLTLTPGVSASGAYVASASVSGSDSAALLHSVYKFNAVAGLKYDILSLSFFDPYIIIVYDQFGNAVEANVESDDPPDFVLSDGRYPVDWIQNWTAPYTGTYYVDMSWNQGSFYKFYYGSIDQRASVSSIRVDFNADFNGDGRDDVLWRSTSGELSNWLGMANGGFLANDANAFARASTSWKIVGTGDFNGDGRDDLLWRNDDGTLSNWLSNTAGGFVPNDANASAKVITAWKVSGIGDFNGDGRDDILWRNPTTGEVSDWLAQPNGGFVANDGNAFSSVPTTWSVVGIGDFNGDGRDDILWRSSDGKLSDWLGQAGGGFSANDANAFAQVPTSWSVVGTGDFNGDGRDDILWRSDSGALSDWLGQANGGFVGNDAKALTSVGTSWKVVGTGDYNGDGRDDILWRNDNGQLSDWLGRADGGFTPNDANAVAMVTTSWQVAAIA